MKKIALIISMFCFVSSYGQTYINNGLVVTSTTNGVLIPRMTTTQRNAISLPAIGLMIYNTTDSAFNFYRTSGWSAIGGGSGSYTFSNGLTEAAGAVKLGGTISESTQIYPDTEDAYNLDIGDPTPFKNIGIYAKNQLYIGTTNPATDWSSEIHFYDDSLVLRPGLSKLYVDSLNYTLSTTGKKILLRDTATGLVQNIDPALLGFGATNTLATFGAGAGLSTDTAAFQLTSIYGSFFWDGTDTLVVTKSCVTLQGTSANIDYDIFFNDSLNVTAGASTILSSINITSTTTAYCTDEGFITTKIPPGNWVWVKTSTLTTKPTYFSLSLIGYKKPVI